MKKFIYSMIILLQVSCGEFLDPQSQTEYVPRDIDALNELLIGNAYMDVTSSTQAIFSLHEIFSDDFSVTVENGNNANNATNYVKNKGYYAWHPDMFILANQYGNLQYVWRDTYKLILGTNAVLDYVDQVSASVEMRNYVRGQALALRAFYYFQLVNLFGEPYTYNKAALGVPLKLNSGLDLTYPKRATVEEVYIQIEKDLAEAEQYYKTLSSEKQFTRDGRITLPMIELLRARVALFKEDYPTVLAYSKKVVENWGLTLLDLKSFTATTVQPYYFFTRYTNPEALWLFGSSTDMSRFSVTELIYINNSATRRMYQSSPALQGSFATGDLRKAQYLLRESTSIAHLRASGKVPVNQSISTVTTDFGRALRVSEAYLMLAEAYYYTGAEALAVAALEQLREHRFSAASGTAYQVPSTARAGEALLEFIRQERRREMCFEGLRWFDQRRYGMDSFTRIWKEEGVVTEFVMLKNDPAFTLPIPFDAIERNPNLEQNTLSTPKY